MGIVFVLVPLTLTLAGLAILAFRWAARGGQLERLEQAAFHPFIEPDELSTERTRGDAPSHDRRE